MSTIHLRFGSALRLDRPQWWYPLAPRAVLIWCRQAHACTRGQQSCLLCHTPSKRRLTNNSRPAQSKQVQPSQSARHKTSPHMKSPHDYNRRFCWCNLATKADLPNLPTSKDATFHAWLKLRRIGQPQRETLSIVMLVYQRTYALPIGPILDTLQHNKKTNC